MLIYPFGKMFLRVFFAKRDSYFLLFVLDRNTLE